MSCQRAAVRQVPDGQIAATAFTFIPLVPVSRGRRACQGQRGAVVAEWTAWSSTLGVGSAARIAPESAARSSARWLAKAAATMLPERLTATPLTESASGLKTKQ